MRINLRFEEYLDLESLEKGIKVANIQVIGQIRFKTETEWSESFPAIIDIGSPVSVIPEEIWKFCIISPLYESQIRGIVSGKNIFIPATFGRIKCLLIDEKGCSPVMESNALFAEKPDVPLILGFSDLLDKVKLMVNYPEKECWIEI